MGDDHMKKSKIYSYKFLIPIAIIYGVFFLLPTILSSFFSLTIWTLTDFKFVGLQNYVTFFTETSLKTSIRNTIIFALASCFAKVVIGFLLAVFINSRVKTQNFFRSAIYFPHLISPLAIGLTFSALMHPTKGLINTALNMIGISGPDWLGNTNIALFSIIFADVWKDIGVAVIIYLAGIQSIPESYYEAASIDGASSWSRFKNITLPLSRPSINTVIILSFIGGLRTFDMVWSMTKGGPGYATDVLASIIYKQYAGGYYGLSTAGNMIMLIIISILAFPLYKYLLNKERDL